VAESPPPPVKHRKPRKLLYVTLPGGWGAIIFACLSFTPSLLPRGGVIQGVICGITAAIGYGLGVWAASIWRAFADREPRPPRRWAWRTFFVSAIVLFAVAFGLGQYWQYEIRKLMGVTDYNIPLVVASPFIACWSLPLPADRPGLWQPVPVGRGTAQPLDRPRAARGVGWSGCRPHLCGRHGVLLQGFIGLMNQAYSVVPRPRRIKQSRPAWFGRAGLAHTVDTLGWQVGKPSEDTEVHRPAAQGADRIYAGLAQPGAGPGRAGGQDLQRAGGFRRKYLAVVTRPAAAGSTRRWLTALSTTGGNCATVAIQYSYLRRDLLPGHDQSAPWRQGVRLRRGLRRVGEAARRSAPKLVVAGESFLVRR
jgi:uncharacterized membrane protein